MWNSNSTLCAGRLLGLSMDTTLCLVLPRDAVSGFKDTESQSYTFEANIWSLMNKEMPASLAHINHRQHHSVLVLTKKDDDDDDDNNKVYRPSLETKSPHRLGHLCAHSAKASRAVPERPVLANSFF